MPDPPLRFDDRSVRIGDAARRFTLFVYPDLRDAFLEFQVPDGPLLSIKLDRRYARLTVLLAMFWWLDEGSPDPTRGKATRPQIRKAYQDAGGGPMEEDMSVTRYIADTRRAIRRAAIQAGVAPHVAQGLDLFRTRSDGYQIGENGLEIRLLGASTTYNRASIDTLGGANRVEPMLLSNAEAPRAVHDSTNTMPSEPPRTLRLLVEPRAAGDVVLDPSRLPLLEVPPAPKYVRFDAEDDGRGAKLRVRLGTRPADEVPVVAVEPVRFGGRSALLVKKDGDAEVRRNGLPTLRLTLCRPGDVLDLGPALLHVFEHRRREIVEAHGDWLERSCPTCCLAFDPDETLCICSCGRGRHIQLPHKPTERKLDCASIGQCECGERLPDEEAPSLPEL